MHEWLRKWEEEWTRAGDSGKHMRPLCVNGSCSLFLREAYALVCCLKSRLESVLLRLHSSTDGLLSWRDFPLTALDLIQAYATVMSSYRRIVLAKLAGLGECSIMVAA